MQSEFLRAISSTSLKLQGPSKSRNAIIIHFRMRADLYEMQFVVRKVALSNNNLLSKPKYSILTENEYWVGQASKPLTKCLNIVILESIIKHTLTF